MNSKLETKIVYNKSQQKAEAAIIWLHGMGADFNDFIPVVNELNLKQSVKFVFPNADVIPVTINNGLKMRAWYDIVDFGDLHREVDVEGVLNNVNRIKDLIESLIHEGFSEDKIILAGFSQGGVISYYTALTSSFNLAGLLILSSYLPDTTILNVDEMRHKKNLPIMVCHGNLDQIVSIAYAKLATQYLQEVKLDFTWHEYPMAHSVCYPQIQDIAIWISKVLSK